jgi:acyl-CoA thioester hydrolase
MMEVYTKRIRVVEEDLDELRHVNNVRYVQWIQDVSREHWLQVAKQPYRDSAVWVVRTHHIHYRNAAVLGDTILLKTHILATRGAISTRVVEMFSEKSGELLVHSKTEWALLNSETLRPMRISEEISTLFRSGGDNG